MFPARFLSVAALLGALALHPLSAQAKGTYFTLEQMLQETFAQTPANKAIWLDKAQKQAATSVLQRPFRKARVKYWTEAGRNLWVLSEIGKEKPITFAVITHDGVIERIEVMAFREIRGDEIRMPAYTAQFKALTLTAEQTLSESIDGISGATYSVRSMKKIARLALLFDQWTHG